MRKPKSKKSTNGDSISYSVDLNDPELIFTIIKKKRK